MNDIDFFKCLMRCFSLWIATRHNDHTHNTASLVVRHAAATYENYILNGHAEKSD